jgi:hypothetical protein
VLGTNRLEKLAARAGREDQPAPPEIFHPVREGSSQAPYITLPAIIEGRFGQPAETHVIRLRVDKAEDLAIEVETPKATRPRFNPVVRLLDATGSEVVTNVYNRVNNNSLQVMKMIEPKTVVSLRAPGEYTFQIHDIATDYVSDDFVYRLFVRRQIPHVGSVDVRPGQINLSPGGSKAVTVSIEREEGFTGLVTMRVKGLPTGVVGVPAMANVDDPPRLENAGKPERYLAKREVATVLLVAAQDAAATRMPVQARLEVSVVGRGGKPAPPILVKKIPVMVVERRSL